MYVVEISAKIVDFFIREQIIEKEDYEIYVYGLEVFAENIGMTLMFFDYGNNHRKWLGDMYISECILRA